MESEPRVWSEGKDVPLPAVASLVATNLGLLQRSNLFESHWLNQWLTSITVRPSHDVRDGEAEIQLRSKENGSCDGRLLLPRLDGRAQPFEGRRHSTFAMRHACEPKSHFDSAKCAHKHQVVETPQMTDPESLTLQRMFTPKPESNYGGKLLHFNGVCGARAAFSA